MKVWWLGAVLGAALAHASAVRAAGPVDLNSAPVSQLQELPGIGPKKAEAIVALRQKRPFTRVSQLLEVRGIGRKTLERLKPLVRVQEPLRGAGPGVPSAAPGAAPAVPPRPAPAVLLGTRVVGTQSAPAP